jgi:hypothetical protein
MNWRNDFRQGRVLPSWMNRKWDLPHFCMRFFMKREMLT